MESAVNALYSLRTTSIKPLGLIFIPAVLKLIFWVEYFQSGGPVNGMEAINNRWLRRVHSIFCLGVIQGFLMGLFAKKLAYKIPLGIKNAGFLQQA